MTCKRHDRVETGLTYGEHTEGDGNGNWVRHRTTIRTMTCTVCGHEQRWTEPCGVIETSGATS